MAGSSMHMVRSGKKRYAYRQVAEINVTPFVDVMLVLLIVFMVTAPMLATGVPIDLPDSQAKAMNQNDDKPLEVTVTKDKKIYVGESEVQYEKLVPLLASILQNAPERVIYVRGDQGVMYGDIMKVIGAINGAGFTKVGLMSEPLKTKK
ncbi:MAG: protein TolR [Alphaproteobacteria bacterium]|nr:protein TolR [Alphaproteobacteria bacterium]